MIGELQIIFGLHPVALHLRVARKAFVLFQKLRRIAAVAIVGTPLRSATLVAASPPPVLSIVVVDQNSCPLSRGARAIAAPGSGSGKGATARQ